MVTGWLVVNLAKEGIPNLTKALEANKTTMFNKLTSLQSKHKDNENILLLD